MKKLIHDIHKGKNLEQNLERYKKEAIQTYSEYGTLELTFSAYTLLEEVEEEKKELAERESTMIDRVLQTLGKLGDGSCPYGELAEQMRKIREDITARMDLFTAYTDRLICYEYVLNRMEYSYLSEKEITAKLSAYPDEEYIQQLLGYLFGDKDQSVVRDKLRLVVSQVPVHLTKNKFFEKISDALTLYQGGDCSALDDFIYILRTSAMLYEPKHYVGEYTDFEELLTKLEEADYTNMTELQYNDMTQVLEKAAQMIHELTDFYYSVQKVVNGIYAMSLVLPYVEEQSKLVKAGRSIWNCLALRQYKAEMLIPLEGRIESCVERSSYLESVLFEIKQSYRDQLGKMSLTAFFDDFSLVANLLSDSLFINLEQVNDEKKADAAYVKECEKKLLAELSDQFSRLSRPVKRAVMGQILEKLPMMFQSSQEVEEYLRVNLLGCQVKSEKAIVMTMLWDLMQEEKEWCS